MAFLWPLLGADDTTYTGPPLLQTITLGALALKAFIINNSHDLAAIERGRHGLPNIQWNSSEPICYSRVTCLVGLLSLQPGCFSPCDSGWRTKHAHERFWAGVTPVSHTSSLAQEQPLCFNPDPSRQIIRIKLRGTSSWLLRQGMFFSIIVLVAGGLYSKKAGAVSTRVLHVCVCVRGRVSMCDVLVQCPLHRSHVMQRGLKYRCPLLLVASLFLVVRPGAPSSVFAPRTSILFTAAHTITLLLKATSNAAKLRDGLSLRFRGRSFTCAKPRTPRGCRCLWTLANRGRTWMTRSHHRKQLDDRSAPCVKALSGLLSQGCFNLVQKDFEGNPV